MKVIYFLFYLEFQSLLIKGISKPNQESQKTQIHFNNDVIQGVKIYTDQNISIHKDRNKNTEIINTGNNDILKEPKQHHSQFQDIHSKDNSELTFAKALDNVVSNAFYEDPNETQKIVDCSKHMDCNKQQKLSQAEQQLAKIKSELQNALDQTEGKKPILVSGNVLRHIISYIKHQDFIDALKNGYQRTKVPKMPQKLIVKKYKPKPINEEEEERKKLLMKRKNQLIQKLSDLKIQFTMAKQEGEEELLQKLEQQIVKLQDGIDDIENEAISDKELEEIGKEMDFVIEEEEELSQNESQDDRQKVVEEIENLKKKVEELELEKKQYEEINDLNVKEDDLQTDVDSLVDQEEQEGINNENLIENIEEKIDDIEKQKEEKKENLFNVDEQQQNESQSTDDNTNQNDTSKNDTSKNDISNLDINIENIPQKFQPGEFSYENLGNSSGEVVTIDENNNLDDFDKKRYQGDSIKDIQPLIMILNNLSNSYYKLYQTLNVKEEELPTDSKNQLKQILLLYHDFEIFLVTYDDNRLKFAKDIRFVTEKFQNMQENVAQLMKYYEQTMEFDELMEIIPNDSKDYQETSQKLKILEENFFKDINTYNGLTEQILNQNNILDKETQYMVSLIRNNEEIPNEVRINLILQTVPKLFVVSKEIQDHIIQLKTILMKFLERKEEIDEVMMELRLISEGRGKLELESKDKLNEFSKIDIISTLVVILLVQ